MGEAIRKMRAARAGACLVETEDGRLAGIVTERDLLVRVPLDGVTLDTTRVEEFMHANPETLTPDHPIVYALNRMAGGGYRNVPLVDGAGRPVGLVTLRDIVEEIIEHFGEEILSLPPTRHGEIAKEREGA
jgi:CBS domain-containing protein